MGGSFRRVGLQLLGERKECLRKLREQQVAALEEDRGGQQLVCESALPSTTWPHLAPL